MALVRDVIATIPRRSIEPADRCPPTRPAGASPQETTGAATVPRRARGKPMSPKTHNEASRHSFSPAVRRLADELERQEHAVELYDVIAHGGLDKALDVEEMARSVSDDLYGQNAYGLLSRRPGESHRDRTDRIGQWAAETVRAAILDVPTEKVR
jgi:pyruvate/2-oxoglutarate dehydrogenase complex dihydrolipoamide acyltransferase (E2) component